jgi:hypothetical protein
MENPTNMTERLSYVRCDNYRQGPGPYHVITVKVELRRGNDEPAEMLLRFDQAQRLRDDLDQFTRP